MKRWKVLGTLGTNHLLIDQSVYPSICLSVCLFVCHPADQSHQQEAANAIPDGQLRAADQATDETHGDGGCGREGQGSYVGKMVDRVG